MLLRMNPVNESEALESFLRLSGGGENITAEDCRTGLFQLLQNIGESLIGDTSERIIDTVMVSLPLHFPMYTLPLARLMELTEVEPHEVSNQTALAKKAPVQPIQERVFRELSSESSWIMVKSRTELELIATPAASIGGSPGEGTFTVDMDRLQLAPVVLQSVKHRLLLYLQNEDLVGYRVCLNLQTVFLRGFPADPLGDLIPGFDEANVDSGSLAVSRFLFQNGFSAVGGVDRQGWSPLHYGALAGDPVLLRSLLEHSAHLDRLTKKPQPQAGVPPRTSALSICLMFKHNEAARILLAAKAQVGSGIQPPISLAAMANNPKGIRILCEAGCKPDMKDILGFSAFDAACGAGSLEAMQELLTQAEYRIDLSRSFFASMSNRGGKAELVELLITLRADMNTPFKQRLLSIHGILFAVKSLQYRLGRHTILTRLAHHGHGATPLMFAVMTGQYEGAAALLAAGASSDARNARNRTVADFAREQSLPFFLREALEGRTEEARELVAVAIASNTFQI
ncbi:kidins220b [Symbiodinium sp. CCMP2456]|nr:kidins220b [Symbiodinium sp. CCMP2456]